jgi:hypothetical protein
MTSERQLNANRTNARASTGPKTRQGKIRSAQNARHHGLSVSVLNDPLLSENVENLAHEFIGEGAGAALFELARRSAEAQIDLIRIRRARHDLWVRKLEGPQLTRYCPRFRANTPHLIAMNGAPFLGASLPFASLKPCESKQPPYKKKTTSITVLLRGILG